MSLQILHILIKFTSFFPNLFFKNLLFSQNQVIKSEILFDTVQYKSEYHNDSFSLIAVPLFLNIAQIAHDIELLIQNKNIVSIISTIVFQEKQTKNEYTHSLVDSNNLYSSTTLNVWPRLLLTTILEKLEVYNTFQKFSVIIQVKAITKI